MNIPKRVTAWVERWISIHQPASTHRLHQLAGDGSTRTFYRLELSNEKFVLLSDPDWISSHDYAPHQKYLKGQGIPVPRFIENDPAAGFLLMEDLGDELLQQRLLSSPTQKLAWLENATRLLAQLHGRTFPVPTSLPVASRQFDQTKFFEEVSFTLEHLHEGLLGLRRPTETSPVYGFCGQIASIRPQVFAHRDYHSRNLLLKANTLYMIDFQDARLGPPHYDVASLIYDAYVPLTIGERDQLVSVYKCELKLFPSLYEKIDWKNWDRDLRRIAFQRVVKAAGSFASFFTRFGKRTHLPYLLPALKTALELGRIPELIPRDVLRVCALETCMEKATQLP